MDWLLIIVKWCAQILATISAIWAASLSLRSDESSREGTRLPQHAKLLIAAVCVGFLAFAMSDVKERNDSRGKARVQETEIRYLEQLMRTGQQLLGLEISWPISEQLERGREPRYVSELIQKIMRDHPQKQINPYFRFAGELLFHREGTGWVVERYRFDRDGGLMHIGPFAPESLEYQIFEEVLNRFVLNSGFWIESTRDKYLVDLPGSDWPSEVRVYQGRVYFKLRQPGISLFDLENTQIFFVMRKGRELANLPPEIRLRSLDSRFALDQTFTLNWQRREILRRDVVTFELEPAIMTVYEFVSGPHELKGSLIRINEIARIPDS